MTDRTLGWTASCLLAVGLVVLGYVLWLPDVRWLKKDNPMLTQYVQLYVRRMKGQGRRPPVYMKWVPLEQVSPYLQRAVLIAEDDRFYKHRGVDWVAVNEAVRYNLRRRQLARGASTISQQVARNLFLYPYRTPGRKVKEMLIARHLERSLPKGRILEIYLNVVEWGEGIFGAEAASLAYFGKHAAELSPEEAVDLAASLTSPYRINPAAPPDELTLKKRRLYLERLRRAGVVDPLPDRDALD